MKEITIVGNISIETEVKLCLRVVRFYFIQRSLVVGMNKILEVNIVEENVLELHVLEKLSQEDWDSSRLTDGYEQSIKRVKNWKWEVWSA
jgi:hypothetical protein